MKTMFQFKWVAVAWLMMIGIPAIEAQEESRSSSTQLVREVRGIRNDFQNFCDRLDRYVGYRRLDQNAQYARRTLRDFGEALDVLIADAEETRPGSPFLLRSVENAQTRYFRAKHYLGYLRLPSYLEKQFGYMTDEINRLDELADRGWNPGPHPNPGHDYPGPAPNPGHDYPGPGGHGNDGPPRTDSKVWYAPLDKYGDEMVDEASDMLHHAQIEAPRSERPHPGLREFQLLKELTKQFKSRAENMAYWTPELVRLHRRIEAQHRTLGRFYPAYGAATAKDYGHFDRLLSDFQKKYPYDPQFERERDRDRDRDWDPRDDRDRNPRDGRENDDRRRPLGTALPSMQERAPSIGGGTWSLGL